MTGFSKNRFCGHSDSKPVASCPAVTHQIFPSPPSDRASILSSGGKNGANISGVGDALNKSGYLLRSAKPEAEPRCSLARVSGAWMATAKPQGWDNASLKREYLGLAVRRWSQLDNRIIKIGENGPGLTNSPAAQPYKKGQCHFDTALFYTYFDPAISSARRRTRPSRRL